MRRRWALVLMTSVVGGHLEAQVNNGSMAGRSTVYAPNGVIATSQPLATAAGLAVLQRGGNAIDAAVTAAAVLNVVEPHMTGIGGDLFAIIWSAEDRRLIGLNASGRSGSGMTREALERRGRTMIPSTGPEAVTVPGALAGWHALLDRLGTMELADALAPAIELAEEGFPVSPIIASQWADAAGRVEQLVTEFPGVVRAFQDTYLVDGHRAPGAGEWFRNPDFASTLRAVAAHGPDVLYGGELGNRIVQWVDQHGGFLTIDDMSAHRVEWTDPLSVSFGDYRLYELPPNGQGIAALEMLKILEGYDLGAMGHNTAPYLHHLIEAKKLAFADLNAFIGDPDHMRISSEQLLSDEYLSERRAVLDPDRATERAEPGALVTTSETIYLSAADRSGNMVSFINSIYSAFGSTVVVPGTGFALQNRGAGFTLEPDVANTVGPRKRPLHTIIPAFATRVAGDGSETPWLSFGVMGGSMQPQGHVQVLLNLLVFGMDLQEAIDAPRFRHLSGRRIALESPVPLSVRERLVRMGHEVLEGAVSYGGAQAVMRLPRGWAAASDPRKDGMASGH